MKAQYRLDPSHSVILFRIKHLGITTITGCFKEFSGEAVFESDDLQDAQISFEAKTDSICTRHEERDEHLRGEDFFDTTKFPAFTFQSKSFRRTGDNTYVLVGDLIIKGIRKQQEFEVRYNGKTQDQFNETRIGFDLRGGIDRHDFDLAWNLITELGMKVLAERVDLNFSLQLVLTNN